MTARVSGVMSRTGHSAEVIANRTASLPARAPRPSGSLWERLASHSRRVNAERFELALGTIRAILEDGGNYGDASAEDYAAYAVALGLDPATVNTWAHQIPESSAPFTPRERVAQFRAEVAKLGDMREYLEGYEGDIATAFGDYASAYVESGRPLDTTSSASVQHFIDTGAYLRHGDAIELVPFAPGNDQVGRVFFRDGHEFRVSGPVEGVPGMWEAQGPGGAVVVPESEVAAFPPSDEHEVTKSFEPGPSAPHGTVSVTAPRGRVRFDLGDAYAVARDQGASLLLRVDHLDASRRSTVWWKADACRWVFALPESEAFAPGETEPPKPVADLVTELLASDPVAALKLFYKLGRGLCVAPFPALIVEPVTDDGETFTGARCPHCETLLAEDGLTVVDWGTFATESDDVNAEEGYHSMSYDHETEMETLHYKCTSCGRPVSLPAGWSEQN